MKEFFKESTEKDEDKNKGSGSSDSPDNSESTDSSGSDSEATEKVVKENSAQVRQNKKSKNDLWKSSHKLQNSGKGILIFM